MSNGELCYQIRSEYQAGETEVRVWIPDGTPVHVPERIVYVLPVEPGRRNQYGDGLDTLRATKPDPHFGFIYVAPTFSDWPWYADHPSEAGIRQESYFVRDVVPLVDSLFPETRGARLLLGYSKSGVGAVTLLLRHPTLFQAAAVWDAPLMKEEPDEFEMPDIYGSQENFEQYRIPRLIKAQEHVLRDQPRLGLFGYSLFEQHMASAHLLLEQMKIGHLYDNSTYREHNWHSGWITQAVGALHSLAATSNHL